jgi:hypothetical protein
MPDQLDWRYCQKCHVLFFDGYPDKGRCQGSGAHMAQGLNFALPYGGAGASPAQGNWRYCDKCHAMFFDGYQEKGQCPGSGNGHNAQGINFSLPHSTASNGSAQGNWRYCETCHAMFYDGYPDKGRCSGGGGHKAQGLVFNLPHRGMATSLSDLKWMGVPLNALGAVAMQEFGAGFRAAAAGQIPDRWAVDLSNKILADQIGFQLGYAKGVLSGLLAGLKNLFTMVVGLFQLALSLQPSAIAAKVVTESFFLLTDAAHRELRKRQIDQAQKIAVAAKATIEDINRNPGDYLVLSREIGESLGRSAGKWVTEDFLKKSAVEIGEIVGSIVGQVLFEIILQVVIELTTAGVGNAARGGLAVGEGARGGSRVAEMIEYLKPLLKRTKGLQKFLRALLMDERGALIIGEIPARGASRFTRVSQDIAGRYLPFEFPAAAELASGEHLHLIDQLERPVKAQGWLFEGAGGSRTGAQRALTGPGAPYHGTQASHLMPDFAGGSGEWFNLVPLESEINLSQMGSLENFMRGRLAEGDQLYLKVYARYDGANKIPSELTYYIFRREATGLKLLEKRMVGGAAPVFVH